MQSHKKGRIQCCPPSFASVAAETKIRRGVQAPQHRRTSNHAAQAALAIAAPPRLSPSPSGPPLQGYSNGLSLSLLYSLCLIGPWDYGNGKKAPFSAKKSRLLASVFYTEFSWCFPGIMQFWGLFNCSLGAADALFIFLNVNPKKISHRIHV